MTDDEAAARPGVHHGATSHLEAVTEQLEPRARRQVKPAFCHVLGGPGPILQRARTTTADMRSGIGNLSEETTMLNTTSGAKTGLSLAALVTACSTTTEALHLRSAAEDYRSLGLNPNAVQPWEDGRRTAQDATSFEWWYFDSLMDDGTAVVVTFSDNFAGDHRRKVDVEITMPDGKPRKLLTDLDEPGTFAKDHTLVKIGPHSFEGDLDTYAIHVDSNNAEKIGLDLTLKRLVPSFRAGTGQMLSGEKYFAWFNAVPRGQVTGNIIVGGKTVAVTGSGYHDHNWGNVPVSDLLDRWWWGRATVGDRTIVTYDIHAKSGSEVALFYVGTPKGIEVNATGDQVHVTEGATEVHSDPNHSRTINASVRYEANGTSATFAASGPMIQSLNLLDGQSWFTRGIAGFLGIKPWYTRFRSPVTLASPGQQPQSGTGILEYLELK